MIHRRIFLTVLLLNFCSWAIPFASTAQPQSKQMILDADIKDIRPIFDLSTDLTWIVWSLVCLLLLILLAIFIWKFKQRKQKLQKPLEPFAEAIQSLQAAQTLLESHLSKELATTLSQTLRTYLERIYLTPASDRTTEEFLSQYAKSLPTETLQSLHHLLTTCDLAKFAKKTFIKTEANQLYQATQALIEAIENKRLQAIASAAANPKTPSPKP